MACEIDENDVNLDLTVDANSRTPPDTTRTEIMSDKSSCASRYIRGGPEWRLDLFMDVKGK